MTSNPAADVPTRDGPDLPGAVAAVVRQVNNIWPDVSFLRTTDVVQRLRARQLVEVPLSHPAAELQAVAACALASVRMGDAVVTVCASPAMAQQLQELLDPVARELGISLTEGEALSSAIRVTSVQQLLTETAGYMTSGELRRRSLDALWRSLVLILGLDTYLAVPSRYDVVGTVVRSAPDAAALRYRAASVARVLVQGRHYTVDELRREIRFRPEGRDAVGTVMGESVDRGLPDVEIALMAKEFLHRGRDYEVRAGQAQHIPRGTTAVQLGGQFPAPMQQAVEAKEGLRITEGPKRMLNHLPLRTLLRSLPRVGASTSTLSSLILAAGRELRLAVPPLGVNRQGPCDCGVNEFLVVDALDDALTFLRGVDKRVQGRQRDEDKTQEPLLVVCSSDAILQRVRAAVEEETSSPSPAKARSLIALTAEECTAQYWGAGDPAAFAWGHTTRRSVFLLGASSSSTVDRVVSARIRAVDPEAHVAVLCPLAEHLRMYASPSRSFQAGLIDISTAPAIYQRDIHRARHDRERLLADEWQWQDKLTQARSDLAGYALTFVHALEIGPREAWLGPIIATAVEHLRHVPEPQRADSLAAIGPVLADLGVWTDGKRYTATPTEAELLAGLEQRRLMLGVEDEIWDRICREVALYVHRGAWGDFLSEITDEVAFAPFSDVDVGDVYTAFERAVSKASIDVVAYILHVKVVKAAAENGEDDTG